MRFRTGLITVGLLLLTLASVEAQSAGRRLLPDPVARRHGLTRQWFTQLEVTSALGAVAHVHEHVSSTEALTVYEVVVDGQVTSFSARNVDRFGNPLTDAEAARQADILIRRLKYSGKEPELVTRKVPLVTLYVMTTRGILHAIDGETGHLRWATAIGDPDYPSLAPTANDQYVATINGSRLYLLDSRDGNIVWQRRLEGAAGSGPAISDEFVFVPTFSGKLEAYEIKEPKRFARFLQSHGRAVLKPTVTPDSVVWPTDRGHLNVAWPTEMQLRFRLEANEAIVAPATYQPPMRLYVSSLDGYVYCIHEVNGSVVWRFSTGESITQSPIVVGPNLYAVTDTGLLYCLNSENGDLKWSASEINSFVAASEQKLYYTNVIGDQLLILDANSGSRLGALPTVGIEFFVQNTTTDRIYMGSRSGLIQCLRETDKPWPQIHVALEEAKPEAAEQAEEPPAEAAPQPVEPPPAEVDPFGAGGGQPPAGNPFGGGGGGNNPFGGGAGGAAGEAEEAENAADNPFGSF